MPDHVQLGFLYSADKQYLALLEKHPRLRTFCIVPQVQSSEVMPGLMPFYMLDALPFWNKSLMWNMMIRDRISVNEVTSLHAQKQER